MADTDETEVSTKKAQGVGWLGEDGICHFPVEVAACTVGYVAPTIPIAALVKMSDASRQKAIDKGWIKFVDGEGDRYTYAEYVKLYPDYPDPVWQLEVRDTWPPKLPVYKKRTARLGSMNR